jgi:hypothetical protein
MRDARLALSVSRRVMGFWLEMGLDCATPV